MGGKTSNPISLLSTISIYAEVFPPRLRRKPRPDRLEVSGPGRRFWGGAGHARCLPHMTKTPIADKPTATPQITIAGLPLPKGTHLGIDPLSGNTHCLVAVTGPGGRVEVRLFVGREERADWRKAVGMMRGVR